MLRRRKGECGFELLTPLCVTFLVIVLGYALIDSTRHRSLPAPLRLEALNRYSFSRATPAEALQGFWGPENGGVWMSKGPAALLIQRIDGKSIREVELEMSVSDLLDNAIRKIHLDLGGEISTWVLSTGNSLSQIFRVRPTNSLHLILTCEPESLPLESDPRPLCARLHSVIVR